MSNNPIEHINGQATWTTRAGDQYVVTGVDRAGQRFKQLYSAWGWASGINLWRGSKWLLRDGKRHLIQRVYN